MEALIPLGFCQCGCGKRTSISQDNDRKNNRTKGMPMQFLAGHHSRNKTGKKCGKWKGGKTITPSGYVLVAQKGHPGADAYGYVFEHVLVVERQIGEFLSPGNVVHHINGIKDDNRVENLLLCKNRSEHTKLHTRLKAELECGNPDWRKCFGCGQYDDTENMVFHCGSYIHKKCNSERRKNRAQLINSWRK